MTTTPTKYININCGTLVSQIPTRWVSDNTVWNGYNTMTDRHYADGWRSAVAVHQTHTTTTPIPPPLQAAIAGYKEILEGYFGEGAHLDEGLDEVTVALTLSLDPEFDAGTALRLKTWSDISAGKYGTTYRPDIYDTEAIVETTTTTTWEPVEP